MKNYKLFGKIPIFDIIIVIVLFAVIIVGASIFLSSKSGQNATSVEKKTIRYTVEFQNISKMIESNVTAGDKVRYRPTDTEVGKVVSAQSKPYYVLGMDTVTGEAVKSILDDRQCVEVVIEATAKIEDSGISVEDMRFGLGRTIDLVTPGITGTCIVRDIEIVEAKA